MTETRRRALKMLGTIGATCAFPFAGDELYGQHVHPVLIQAPESGPYKPAFFTPAEYAVLSRLTDVIIPPTDTPGAAAAGVPEYIDRVVSLNAQHQPLVREGLAWLERQATERFSKSFLSLDEAGHVAMLQPLSDEIDRQQRDAQRARFRTEAGHGMVYYVAITDKDLATPPPVPTAANAGSESGLPVRFLRLIKNLTADGYYTSRVGLLAELGYAGNTALAAFPGCTVREQ
jgi:gluconate 2-dehydrogenase gamma chain